MLLCQDALHCEYWRYFPGNITFLRGGDGIGAESDFLTRLNSGLNRNEMGSGLQGILKALLTDAFYPTLQAPVTLPNVK